MEPELSDTAPAHSFYWVIVYNPPAVVDEVVQPPPAMDEVVQLSSAVDSGAGDTSDSTTDVDEDTSCTNEFTANAADVDDTDDDDDNDDDDDDSDAM